MGRIQRRSRDGVDSVAGWNLQPPFTFKKNSPNPPKRALTPIFTPQCFAATYVISARRLLGSSRLALKPAETSP